MRSHSGPSAGAPPMLHTTSTSPAGIVQVGPHQTSEEPPSSPTPIAQPVTSIGLESGFRISSALLKPEPSTYSLNQSASSRHAVQPSPATRLPSSQRSRG